MRIMDKVRAWGGVGYVRSVGSAWGRWVVLSEYSDRSCSLHLGEGLREITKEEGIMRARAG